MMYDKNTVSIYLGSDNIGLAMINQVFSDIHQGVYNKDVTRLREVINELENSHGRSQKESESLYAEKSDLLFKRIPSFTPAGVFNGLNKKENLIQLSGIIAIPVYETDSYYLSKSRWRTEDLPYVKSVCVNSMYDGIIVFVETNLQEPYLYEEFAEEINYNLDWDAEVGARYIPELTAQYHISSDPGLNYNANTRPFSELDPNPLRTYESIVKECELIVSRKRSPEYFMMTIFERLVSARAMNYLIIRRLSDDFPELMSQDKYQHWLRSYIGIK